MDKKIVNRSLQNSSDDKSVQDKRLAAFFENSQNSGINLECPAPTILVLLLLGLQRCLL